MFPGTSVGGFVSNKYLSSHDDNPRKNSLTGGNDTKGRPQNQAKDIPSPDLSPFSGTININELVPGSSLDANIFSQQGLLLLKAGSVITEQFIRRLRNQGLMTVRVLRPVESSGGVQELDLSDDEVEESEPICQEKGHVREVSEADDDRQAVSSVSGTRRPLHLDDQQVVSLETKETARLDESYSESGFPDIACHGRRIRGGAKMSIGQLRDLTRHQSREMYDKAMGRYAFAVAQAVQMKPDAVEVLTEIVNHLRRLVMADDSLPLLLMQFRATDENEYLYQHGLNVALLSMTMVYQLGLSHDALFAAGISSLFQDAGMLKVPIEVRSAARELTIDEVLEIQRHPVHVLDLMEKSHALNDVTRMICYQHHERCDRSGYPRRRHGMFVHPFARIIAVADTYTALTSSRPYREVFSPYQAVLVILDEVRNGRLDRMAVRAFLDCVSLFPVGSHVQLSDGNRAKVIRSNHAQHTRPVVIPLNSDGSESDELLDLSKTDTCRVVSAMAA